MAVNFLLIYPDNFNQESLVEKPFRRILIIKMRFHGTYCLPLLSSKAHAEAGYPDAKSMCFFTRTPYRYCRKIRGDYALYISNKGAGTKRSKNALSLIKICVLTRMITVVNLTVSGAWRLLCVFKRKNKNLADFGNQSALWKSTF